MRRCPVIVISILMMLMGSSLIIYSDSGAGSGDLPEIIPLDTQTPLDMSEFDRDIDHDLVDDLLEGSSDLDIVDGYIGLNVHMTGPRSI